MFERARDFADVLYDARFTTVIPFKTYEALEEALLAGEIDAAWGPPMICARVEDAGGAVAFRAIRGGSTVYRAALLARAQDRFELPTLAAGAFRPRAVWVDRWSMGGYLLPRAHLRAAGIDLGSMMLSEKTLGSYTACFDAVMRWEADLTATFVGSDGFEAHWGGRVKGLRAIAYTEDTPNDAIVLGRRASTDRMALVIGSLQQLLASRRAHDILTKVFEVDDFERPPRHTYAPLLRLLDRPSVTTIP